MSKNLRILLISALGLLLLAVGFGTWLSLQPPKPTGIVSSETRSSGTALIGGPFSLTDHTGARRSEADLQGRYSLIFFGYTYCPDICPTSLSTITQGLDILAESSEAKAAAVTPIFVSVDPARDTIEALADYVSHFHPSMLGMTGSEAEVAQTAKAYRVFYKKVEQADASDYLMDHSSIIYLMAPDGSYLSHFTHATTAEEIAEGLAQQVDPAQTAGS
ncbi:SCO family protein [Pelagibius litoralis]|uniref:SCO family protein n=1 Tax=Pelagibius litoralis TaxID=374515 RepID=A0A967C1V6_9PROT|nr:SCO family protein [Pelagibius litoralis]NIA68101.1 SCO family protein [Pelagibius litoralis]